MPIFRHFDNEVAAANTQASAGLSGSIRLRYEPHAVQQWKQACIVLLTPGRNTRPSEMHCCTSPWLLSANCAEQHKQWSNKCSGVGAKASADLIGFCPPPKDTSSLISWQPRKFKDCLELLNQWKRTSVSASLDLPRGLAHASWSGEQGGHAKKQTSVWTAQIT